MNDNKKERWKKLMEEESRKEDKKKPVARSGMVVNHPKVNIRTKPSMDSGIMVVVSQGETYDILEELPDWFKINYDGHAGYISSKYFKEMGV